jgi:phage anti-repressor protein
MAEVVDWSKFFQYFKKFYRNLASLEECFHEKKIKFTKNLAKLNTLTQQVEFSKETTISLEPDRTEHKKKYFIRPENHIKSKKSIPIEKS